MWSKFGHVSFEISNERNPRIPPYAERYAHRGGQPTGPSGLLLYTTTEPIISTEPLLYISLSPSLLPSHPLPLHIHLSPSTPSRLALVVNTAPKSGLETIQPFLHSGVAASLPTTNSASVCTRKLFQSAERGGGELNRFQKNCLNANARNMALTLLCVPYSFDSGPSQYPFRFYATESVSSAVSTRWSTTFSAKVKSPHAIISRFLCDANLVTKVRGNEKLELYRTITLDAPLLGSYSRTIPRVIWCSQGGSVPRHPSILR